MVTVNDITNKVRDYLDGDYVITDTEKIPSADEVAFGKIAKRMKLTAFCIDIRKSTDLLTVHEKQTCGKIHKSFLYVVSQIVQDYGGEIRSFNGDGLLAFWPSNKAQNSQAVRAALVIKYLIDEKLSPLFETYSKIDFGIGIDSSDVYIVRAGIPRNANNNDLVFIGNCVNFATKIADQAHSPNHVEISESIYSNIEENCIYSTNNNQRVNIWVDNQVQWKGSYYKTKNTHYRIEKN